MHKRQVIDLLQMAHIDIAYYLTFFGVSHHESAILFSMYRDKYKEKFISEILQHITRKPLKKKTTKLYKNWKKLSELKFKITYDLNERENQR